MEKTREVLASFEQVSDTVAELPVSPHQPYRSSSFYERFALKGIKVQQSKPGFVSCTFRVPARLTDAEGNLSTGAIANLVDEIGATAVHGDGQPMKVSVDMSISFMAKARVNDELEIVSRALGQKGSYYGTNVLLRNKTSGEPIAEGRHSLFARVKSKI